MVKLNLTGHIFGRLTAQRYVGKQKKHSLWECSCSCGVNTTVTVSRLRSGHTKSCGCLQRDFMVDRNKTMIKKNKKPEGISAMNTVLKQYRYHARMRGHCWNLTEDQGHDLLKGSCYYCGTDPKRLHFSPRNCSQALVNGIDRLDNTQGYEPFNTVSCCTDCNMMKKTMTVDKFLNLIKKISSHQDQ